MRETLHLGDRVGAMLKDLQVLLEQDKLALSREIAAADDGVDTIHEAIKLYPLLEKFLGQDMNENSDLASGYAQLKALLESGGE